MGSGGRCSSSSSSGEEDGDADWKAAIDSVATSSFGCSLANGFVDASNGSTPKRLDCSNPSIEEDTENKKNHANLKHYHIKAQKLLDNILEKTLETVKDPIDIPDNDVVINEGGVRLFKHAPSGIVFDHIDELQQPKRRPKILPGKEIDEKSKKFRRQLQSVAVDGIDIMATAEEACQKSLARLEARDAAAKALAKREEERVAELRRIRGERWLPSVASEMGLKFQSK